MDNGTDHAYSRADGTAIDTGTESGVRAALADVHTRLLELETRPAGTGDTGAGTSGNGDIARILAVIGPYFRDQFTDYDAAQPKPVEPAAVTDPGPSPGGGAGTVSG